MDLSQHKIEIVLGAAEIAQLEQGDPASAGLAVTVNELEPSAPISKAIVQSASILCLEVHAGVPRSLGRIGELRAEYPNLPIVALVRDADVALVRSLLRQGVNDVVDLQLSLRKLTESIGEILGSVASRPASVERRSGKLIAVVKSIGGVGATNVAVNLAASLGEQRPTCLFDLDIQFGSAATYLSAQSEPSLRDLLEGGARVDGDFLKAVASEGPGSLRFVPAPSDIQPIEAVDGTQIRRIIRTARGEFDYVVTDLPANWTNWTLALVAEADIVLLVVTLSIASLRQGKRQIQLLRSHGIDPARIHVLINRVEQRLFKTIGPEDAAKALGHPVDLSIHNDYPLVNGANNQGVLLADLGKRSKVARDYAKIAETVTTLVEQA